ncbi:MAG TPA: NAD(+)/NADH kinase [bacterium]|jgi:NAD+ kinase|nr:NAD(+)/NADH kinase [bacterium]
MPQNNVLVVYKESTYSRYGTSQHLVRGFKKNKYWEVLKGSHDRHAKTLESVCAVLREKNFKVTTLLRSKVEKLKNIDREFKLVVSVGGDGTFLDCSHHLWKTPILGVNSDPQQSVARLSGSDGNNFGRVLERYLLGKEKPSLVWRLDFFINGKKSSIPVLNDLLISTLSPGGTSRYILKAGKRSEEQMSSGIWVSSAAGSTAAVLSAGGKAFPATAKRFQFVAREVYHRKFGTRNFLSGVFNEGQTLEVISYMRQGRIFIDGSNLVLMFKVGDRLKIKLSSRPLKVVGLKD